MRESGRASDPCGEDLKIYMVVGDWWADNNVFASDLGRFSG